MIVRIRVLLLVLLLAVTSLGFSWWIDWGGPQIVLVNVVNVFSVDNTGISDVGAQMNAALSTLGASGGAGQSAFVPAGTYNVATAISNPLGIPILVSPLAVIRGTNAATLYSTAAPLGPQVTVYDNSIVAGGPNALGAGFAQSANNPVFPAAMESSYLLAGNELDNWYRSTADNKLYFAYSTDPASDIWTIGNGGAAISDTNAALSGVEQPYVINVGGVYYMAGRQAAADAGTNFNEFLWYSTDKITWNYANGGNPILHHSATTTDWYYTIFNPSLAVNGSTWYLVQDGEQSGGQFAMGYSYATMTGSGASAVVNFDPNLTHTPILLSSGAPFLQYVPDRNALLVLYANFPAAAPTNLRAIYGLLSTDLTLAANWIAAPGFGIQSVGDGGTYSGVLSDPTLVFRGAAQKSWGNLLGYSYAQVPGYNAAGSATLDQFYDTLTSPLASSAGNGAPGQTQIAGRLEVDGVDLGHYGTARITTDVNSNLAIYSISDAGHVSIQAGGGNVGIGTGTTAPGAALEVIRNGVANQLAGRFNNPGGNSFVELAAGGYAAQLWSGNNGAFRVYTGSTLGTLGTEHWECDQNGQVTFFQHLVSSGAAPSAAATGSGYSVTTPVTGGTDLRGQISAAVAALTAGAVTVTFHTAYGAAPLCQASPANSAAAVDSAKGVWVTSATGTVTLNFPSTVTGGAELWNYECIQ